jgi:hypothetical protein
LNQKDESDCRQPLEDVVQNDQVPSILPPITISEAAYICVIDRLQEMIEPASIFFFNFPPSW